MKEQSLTERGNGFLQSVRTGRGDRSLQKPRKGYRVLHCSRSSAAKGRGAAKCAGQLSAEAPSPVSRALLAPAGGD